MTPATLQVSFCMHFSRKILRSSFFFKGEQQCIKWVENLLQCHLTVGQCALFYARIGTKEEKLNICNEANFNKSYYVDWNKKKQTFFLKCPIKKISRFSPSALWFLRTERRSQRKSGPELKVISRRSSSQGHESAPISRGNSNFIFLIFSECFNFSEKS